MRGPTGPEILVIYIIFWGCWESCFVFSLQSKQEGSDVILEWHPECSVLKNIISSRKSVGELEEWVIIYSRSHDKLCVTLSWWSLLSPRGLLQELRFICLSVRFSGTKPIHCFQSHNVIFFATPSNFLRLLEDFATFWIFFATFLQHFLQHFC